MKRILVIGLTAAMTVAMSPVAEGAKKKPLKATSNGWYVFDGVGSASKTPKNGTYTRCVNDPSTPPVIGLGGRYSIVNKSLPAGSKYILNGPNGFHLAQSNSAKVKPGAYYHIFRASAAGRSSLEPGVYHFKLKTGTRTLTTESITLVDDASC